MNTLKRGSDSSVIEHSHVVVLIFYSIGICLFVLDMVLAVCRFNSDVLVLNLRKSPCSQVISTEQFELNLTLPLVEYLLVFIVFLVVYSWICTFEWFRASQWEYSIRYGDKNGEYLGVKNQVKNLFPFLPSYREDARYCNSRKVYILSLNWSESSENEDSSSHLMFFVTCCTIQWMVLTSSRCFVYGIVTVSNMGLMGTVFMCYHWAFGFILLGTMATVGIVLRQSDSYYTEMRDQVLDHLVEDKGLERVVADKFLDKINKRGLLYLTMMAEEEGAAHFEYLLMLLTAEYCSKFHHKVMEWTEVEAAAPGTRNELFCSVDDESRPSSWLQSSQSSTYESFDVLKQAPV